MKITDIKLNIWDIYHRILTMLKILVLFFPSLFLTYLEIMGVIIIKEKKFLEKKNGIEKFQTICKICQTILEYILCISSIRQMIDWLINYDFTSNSKIVHSKGAWRLHSEWSVLLLLYDKQGVLMTPRSQWETCKFCMLIYSQASVPNGVAITYPSLGLCYGAKSLTHYSSSYIQYIM